VGNLSVRYNRKNLRDVFVEYGSITNVEVKQRSKDYSSLSGFGFVTFSSFENANDAKEKINGFFQFGRRLRSNLSFDGTINVVNELFAE
jgi:RNA recognition motif-containing protein